MSMPLHACLIPEFVHRGLRRIRKSPLASRLAHGSFWSLAGSLVSRVLALGAAIVAARILGKSSYGELGVIQSTIGMFGVLAGFGMGTTAAKFIGEFRARDREKTGRVIALSSVISWVTGIVLGGLLVVTAGWLARNTLAAPELTPYLQISALLLLLNGINGAQTGALSGFEAFQKIAWVSGLSGLLNFPFVIGGAFYFGLGGVVWGMILAQAGGCLANYVILRREAARHQVPISYRSWTREFPIVWRFSIPAVLGGLLMNPVSWVCTAMLVRQPAGLEEVGAFNAANQWFGALLWMPGVLAQATLPMLAERVGAGDGIRSAKLLSATLRIVAAATIPIVLAGSLCSVWIMGAYGKDFTGDWSTLVVVFITGGLAAIQIPIGSVIAAAGRMWLGFGMNLVWSIIFLTAGWLFLSWGALGLASARLLAYVAQGILAFTYAALLLRRIVPAPGRH